MGGRRVPSVVSRSFTASFVALFRGIHMRRYYFHIRCGDRALLDGVGRLLPGLSEAASEAERIVRTLMQRDQAMFEDWDDWRLDVRDSEEVLLFALPFSDVRLDRMDVADLVEPEALPDTKALWDLTLGQHAH